MTEDLKDVNVNVNDSTYMTHWQTDDQRLIFSSSVKVSRYSIK